MTIATLSIATPSRWSELHSCARPAEASRESKPKAVDKPSEAKTTTEREGPRRSPLFGAIKEALEELVATEADAADSDGDKLDQALADFARAVMHALRDDRRPAWSNAAQRVEALARKTAPASTAPAAKAPVDTTPPAATVPIGDAQTLASTTIPTTTTATTSAPTVRLTLELSVPESPWASVHDGLIDAFAEVQRALGRPASRRDDSESLEERLREMLVAMAAKLRASAAHTAALAPPGSLLSVVA